MTTRRAFWHRWTTTTAHIPTVDWDEVYTAYLPCVYNFFVYRVQDTHLAEDLTATTFLRAWSSRERYRQDLGAFSTWVFTIARRVAADHFKQQRPMISLEQLPFLPDGTAPPEEVIQQAQMLTRLQALLQSLPIREQELIALKYGAGLNNRQIAQLMQLSESNVGTILSRVIHKLRHQWELNE
jgi:RNA polymerase sigma-70 factor (ECF subfamily)